MENLILLICIINFIILIFILLKKDNDNHEKIINSFRQDMSVGRTESYNSEKRLREELINNFKNLADSMDKRLFDFSNSLNDLIEKNDAKMDKVRNIVESKLEAIQKNNEEKLEKMRLTVDEKLNATLEKRFNESFKMVSDRLEAVHKGLGEMQNLAVGVGDLKKVLSNVKSRGTWGEVQLKVLIEEILTPDQYEKNVKIKNFSKENVEFAVKLPGYDNENNSFIWLPIDAKFPLEDYQKLIEARENGDLKAIDDSLKSLETRIKSEAKDIKEKYIDPPNTTDFGILFLPIESLYAEILRKPGLFEYIRREYRIVIASPTTMQVILNSLNMGFRTLKVQKRSSEVWNLLGKVKTDFGRFGDLLDKTHKKIQEAGNIIEDASKKTRMIEKSLDNVQSLPIEK